MPLTVKVNVPLAASAKVSVPLPTATGTTSAGSNGVALNGGPLVLYSVPVNVLPPLTRFAVIDSHHALPPASYVNHVAKTMSP